MPNTHALKMYIKLYREVLYLVVIVIEPILRERMKKKAPVKVFSAAGKHEQLRAKVQ